jgi:hypothetical protein
MTKGRRSLSVTSAARCIRLLPAPLAMDAATWLGMDEAAFEALCGRTPLTRSGLVRIRENALRNAEPEEPSER